MIYQWKRTGRSTISPPAEFLAEVDESNIPIEKISLFPFARTVTKKHPMEQHRSS